MNLLLALTIFGTRPTRKQCSYHSSRAYQVCSASGPRTVSRFAKSCALVMSDSPSQKGYFHCTQSFANIVVWRFQLVVMLPRYFFPRQYTSSCGTLETFLPSGRQQQQRYYQIIRRPRRDCLSSSFLLVWPQSRYGIDTPWTFHSS